MKYASSRGGPPPVSFSAAVMTGLADDGGLLLPESIPRAADRLDDWRRLAYPDLACEIMGLFIGDIDSAALRAMVERSYSTFRCADVVKVVPVGPVHILELFHGPTLAFKDVALQFLGNLFEHLLARSQRTLNILAATSGDTGSAAIHGLRGRDRIRIFVLHPRGRVSPTQERQMTTVLDDNVFNVAVEGSFDDCQAIVKTLFSDLPLKSQYALGAVNSINWARILAQIVYYFYAAFRVMEQTGQPSVRFCVPTGNFGNIFAGYLAARMGLPVRQLVLATNENDVLARFFQSGEYRPAPAQPSLSPSMDIQVASNFERYLYYRLGEDPSAVCRRLADLAREGRLCLPATAGTPTADPLFAAGSADSAATLAAMRRYYRQYGYLADPHSAVGLAVAERGFIDDDTPTICLATAHPAKFGQTVRQALDADLAHHPAIDRLHTLATRCDVLPASAPRVREYIAAHIDMESSQREE
jgi:threonine synthase